MRIKPLFCIDGDALGHVFQWPAQCAVLAINCGDGSAVRAMTARARGALRYGIVEHRYARNVARQYLHNVVSGCLYPRAANAVRVKEEAFSLLAVNAGVRDEDAGLDPSHTFERLLLRQAPRYLVPGGVMVYVFNRSRFMLTEARMLAADFEDWHLFRLPTESLALVAKKRPERVLDPKLGSDLLNRTRAFIPPPGREPVMDVPETEPIVSPFRGGMDSPEDACGLSLQSPLWQTVKAATEPRETAVDVRPPLAMRSEHIGLLATCGYLDRLAVGTGPDAHILRGMAFKTEDVSAGYDDDGNAKEVCLERFGFRCRLLRRDGRIMELLDEAGGDA